MSKANSDKKIALDPSCTTSPHCKPEKSNEWKGNSSVSNDDELRTPKTPRTPLSPRTPMTPKTPKTPKTPRTPRNQRLCSWQNDMNVVDDGVTRTVYLIRHGESQGQRCSYKERSTNDDLRDCGLTLEGMEQAKQIPFLLEGVDIQMVVTSPLTRAIHTTLLAFPNPEIPIWVGYDLRELGSSVPENRPRRFTDIWRDLNVDSVTLQRFDLESLAYYSSMESPQRWPRGHDTPPKVIQKDHIRRTFLFLAKNLPKHITTIAVVCHFHVIRTALTDPYDVAGASHIYPNNAQPISCLLLPNGRLVQNHKSKNHLPVR